MSQINIEILKKPDKVYKNVLSASFFTMPNAYRNVSSYQRAFSKFILAVPDNFEIRIYTDDTGKDFLLKYKNPNLSIYHYNCEEFREGVGHTGTFGTIVRFLPLFEKHDLVWISDIDLPDYFFDTKHILRNDYDVFIYTNICYERKPFSSSEYHINAGKFISRVQFPKQLLTRFLNKILSGEIDTTIATINKYNEGKKKPNKLFPYGVDEVFMNTYIYNSIVKHNLKILQHKSFYADGYIKHLSDVSEKEKKEMADYYATKSKLSFQQTKKIYKKYLPLLVSKYPCLQELIDKMDTFTSEFDEFNHV